MTPQEEIEAAWFQIENAFDIEPRSYFEAEAPKNGFGSPLAMAVFYLTKRDPKMYPVAMMNIPKPAF